MDNLTKSKLKQVLCNELGLTREDVREIVSEQVEKYIKQIAPDVETLIRTCAANVTRDFINSQMKDSQGRIINVQEVVVQETERQLKPYLMQMVARMLP